MMVHPSLDRSTNYGEGLNENRLRDEAQVHRQTSARRKVPDGGDDGRAEESILTDLNFSLCEYLPVDFPYPRPTTLN